MDDVLDASIASRGNISSARLKTSFHLRVLDDRLDHEIGCDDLLDVGHASEHLVGVQRRPSRRACRGSSALRRVPARPPPKPRRTGKRAARRPPPPARCRRPSGRPPRRGRARTSRAEDPRPGCARRSGRVPRVSRRKAQSTPPYAAGSRRSGRSSDAHGHSRRAGQVQPAATRAGPAMIASGSGCCTLTVGDRFFEELVVRGRLLVDGFAARRSTTSARYRGCRRRRCGLVPVPSGLHLFYPSFDAFGGVD